jgi:hypothetical protein
MRFEVSIAVKLWNVVSCAMMPCNLVCDYRRFNLQSCRWFYPENGSYISPKRW